MNLESQVCSLEYAKKLKELGVKQNSFFSWQSSINPGIYKLFPNVPFFPNVTWREDNKKTPNDGYSAFTVAELIDLLPHRVTTNEVEPYNSYRLKIEKGIWCKDNDSLTFIDMYSANYYCDTTSAEFNWIAGSLTKNMVDENPANALAKMLIFLLENGLIKNDDIQKD